MDYINRQWFKVKNQAISARHKHGALHLKNPSDRHGFFAIPQLFEKKGVETIQIRIEGTTTQGDAVTFQLLNLKRTILSEISFNSSAILPIPSERFIFSIKIPAHSETVIRTLDIAFSDKPAEPYSALLENKSEILIIAPSYPTEENKYFGAFVHSRAKAYQDAGVKFDLVCAYTETNNCNYSFEGVQVHRMSMLMLRNLLQRKKYSTILLHFFDAEYAKILDAVDLKQTRLFFWVHGPETLYWDWSEMTDPYFVPKSKLTEAQITKFRANDILIKRYNDNPNVHWIFVSEWIKKRSEELIRIHFKNFTVIPNFVDEKNFSFEEKPAEQRFKIFILRRFENINKYAMDVNVRTILELSRREIFDQLEFHIYGTGLCYDNLIAPVRQFSNVHLHRHFMTHSEIARAHKQSGIGLFATRYDAQGVSVCEAAMSGLVIVSSENEAIAEFLPSGEEDGLLCETENYVAYADRIESLCQDPKKFSELSRKCHDKVYEKCNFNQTIQREIDLIRTTALVETAPEFERQLDKVLSVIVPAYNVALYLEHGVSTLLDHENAGKIEIIIVNDGSKDRTVEVAGRLREKYGDDIIVVIDKENGGHGSTINAGLKVARGKYVRVMDGDDWVNSRDLAKLIDRLGQTDADIVITDYSEDIAVSNLLLLRTNYMFMVPGQEYQFDDLCYNVYGFWNWGPILATGNFKTKMLRDTQFTLTEKCFYIDMEFDVYSILKANTIIYFPLDIYRYYIGRSGQSISEEAYRRNFKQHETVLLNIIRIYDQYPMSKGKRWYVLNKIINPMLIAHYTILINYLHSGEEYWAFEQKLRQYPEVYEQPEIATRMKRLHRLTQGKLVQYDGLIKKAIQKIR